MATHVCVNCGKDLRVIAMRVGVDYGQGHVYPGDVLECPKCKNQIIYTIGVANFDPEYNAHQAYIRSTNGIRAPDEKLWSDK